MGRKDKKAFGAHYRGRDTMFHVKHSLLRFWTTAVGVRRRLLATWNAKLHEYVGTCRCWGVRQRGVDWAVSAGEGQSADGHDVSRGTFRSWNSVRSPVCARPSNEYMRAMFHVKQCFSYHGTYSDRVQCFTWNIGRPKVRSHCKGHPNGGFLHLAAPSYADPTSCSTGHRCV